VYAKRQVLKCITCAEAAYLGGFRVGITFLKSSGADFKKLYINSVATFCVQIVIFCYEISIDST